MGQTTEGPLSFLIFLPKMRRPCYSEELFYAGIGCMGC